MQDYKNTNIRFLFLSNVVKYRPKHYVHIGMYADWKNGEPKVLEPDKIESWQWYHTDHPPSPLFEMCKQSFDAYLNGEFIY